MLSELQLTNIMSTYAYFPLIKAQVRGIAAIVIQLQYRDVVKDQT
jgi:hypothetical protein